MASNVAAAAADLQEVGSQMQMALSSGTREVEVPSQTTFRSACATLRQVRDQLKAAFPQFTVALVKDDDGMTFRCRMRGRGSGGARAPAASAASRKIYSTSPGAEYSDDESSEDDEDDDDDGNDDDDTEDAEEDDESDDDDDEDE